MSPCRIWTKYTFLINILDMAPACCSQMFAQPHATNILGVLESTLSYFNAAFSNGFFLSGAAQRGLRGDRHVSDV